MAKELPYFKFEPSEWLVGDIQMCTNDAKLYFIDICCYYWNKLGDLTKNFALKKCCEGREDCFQELLDMGVLSVKKDIVIIKFLDRQLEDFSKISKSKSESGRKGGQKGGVRPEIERVKGNQIYIIRCFNDGEEFLKMGTTTNNISRRYSGKMPYQYEVLFQLRTDEFIELECELSKKFEKYSIIPKLNFPGSKECYSISYYDEINLEINHRTSFALAPLKRNETIREEKKREEKSKKEKIDLGVKKKNFFTTLQPFLEKYGKNMLNDFALYWSEPNKSESKLRWELEKTWSLSHRLERWAKNDKNFQQTNPSSEKVTMPKLNL